MAETPLYKCRLRNYQIGAAPATTDAAQSVRDDDASPMLTLPSVFACVVTADFFPSVPKAVFMRPSTFQESAASAGVWGLMLLTDCSKTSDLFP